MGQIAFTEEFRRDASGLYRDIDGVPWSKSPPSWNIPRIHDREEPGYRSQGSDTTALRPDPDEKTDREAARPGPRSHTYAWRKPILRPNQASWGLRLNLNPSTNI